MMRSWSRRTILAGGVASLLAACAHGQTGDIGYSIAVSGESNQVIIGFDPSRNTRSGKGTYIATIHSLGGIGQATTAWWGSTSPHPLVFCLHLSGLEQFRLRWRDQTGTLSVNSNEQTVIQSVQGTEQGERAITPDSPYWIEVAVPTLETPRYELIAPAAFLAAAPTFWGIAWVDFYR